MNLNGSYHKGYSQHLQYLDSIKSSTKDLSLPLHEIVIHPIAFSGDRGWYALEPKLICWHVAMRTVDNTA